ncbi:MAG: helix-turn-helix domain-containing protein, partial [Proteobacteria bacterium]|nr:helix-turn-helix domain-containing protein [Pseudomonadota bacterium]
MKLSIKEVAQCLQLPLSTVERWIRQGRIPIQRSGDGLIFNVSVLEKWAATHNLSFKKPHRESAHPNNAKPENLLAVMKRGGVFHGVNGDDVHSVLKSAV